LAFFDKLGFQLAIGSLKLLNLLILLRDILDHILPPLQNVGFLTPMLFLTKAQLREP
jgi:hypothetical protein